MNTTTAILLLLLFTLCLSQKNESDIEPPPVLPSKNWSISCMTTIMSIDISGKRKLSNNSTDLPIILNKTVIPETVSTIDCTRTYDACIGIFVFLIFILSLHTATCYILYRYH